MSNVIDVLERIGQDSNLRYGAAPEVERALLESGVDPGLRAALARGDYSSLEKLLGAKTDMCCLIHAPEEQEDDGNCDVVAMERVRR